MGGRRLPEAASPRGPALNRPAADAADDLAQLDSRRLLFYAAAFLLLGLIWFGATMALYVYSTGYHVNVLYEARWMLSTLLICGVLTLLLAVTKAESALVSLGLGLVYAIAAALTTLLIYALNFARAVAQGVSTPLQRAIASPGRTEYIQLCAVLVLLAAFAIATAAAAAVHLARATRRLSTPTRLSDKTRRGIQLVAVFQGSLALFSIYVTSQIISLSFSYIHTYMIQELFCGILLLGASVAQVLLLLRPHRLALNFLFFLNLSQFFQELFYSWNAYYISLYIYSSSSTNPVGIDNDQVVMTLNFFGHFARLCLVVWAGWRLLGASGVGAWAGGGRVELGKSAFWGLGGFSGAAFLLSALHVKMDVVYALNKFLYRTLFAFTGISVFYALALGLSIAVFLIKRNMVFPVLGLVFSVMLGSVSAHTIFVYLQTCFSASLSRQLEQMGRDKRRPALMHFNEALLGFFGLCLAAVGGFLIMRILRLESRRESRSGEKLSGVIRALRVHGWVLFALTMLEALFVFMIKAGWKATDITLSYSVLDMASTLILCGLILHITAASNSRIFYPLLSLFCLLLADALTTFNYLSAYTTYIQLLLMLGRMPRAVAFADYFPISHLLLVLLCHVIQILQWVVSVSGAVTCGVVLESLGSSKRPPLELRPNGVSTLQAVYANAAFEQAQGEGLVVDAEMEPVVVVGAATEEESEENELNDSEEQRLKAHPLA